MSSAAVVIGALRVNIWNFQERSLTLTSGKSIYIWNYVYELVSEIRPETAKNIAKRMFLSLYELSLLESHGFRTQ